jgi:hypothetical protein
VTEPPAGADDGFSSDRHALYELCVQRPEELASLLRRIHGGVPVTLGEDFCGTMALSRAWVRTDPAARAVAVDRDASVLHRPPQVRAVRRVLGDVVEATSRTAHAVDVLHAGNFSIGEWTTRVHLMTYLRHARARLRPGGVFVCDVYGGESAFLTGSVDREHPGPGGAMIRYTWEQRSADPITGRVVNAMHFEVRRGGAVVAAHRDAFVYSWRLWGVAELRDAMDEAGFVRSDVFSRGEPVRPLVPGDLEAGYDVLIAARAT